MLRDLIIMTGSGLVLFNKEFVKVVQEPRMTGSLITALLEFSTSATGLPVAYIEMDKIGISLATDKGSAVTCALFHDRGDGANFGRVLSRQVLDGFVATYQRALSATINLKMFIAYHNMLNEQIRSVIRPILWECVSVRGITQAFVVAGEQVAASTSTKLDQVAVLANLQPLVRAAADQLLLGAPGEGDLEVFHITVEAGKARVVVSLLDGGKTLVVVAKRSADFEKLLPVIRETRDLLQTLFTLLRNLGIREL